MIEKIICENDSSNNYEQLTEDKKLKYEQFWKQAECCPEKYILSVDVANSNSKDQSAVVKYDYEEYLKGNMVVKSIEYF